MPRPATQDIPRGFAFAATACGLKKSGLDVAAIVSETPGMAAAMFTTNLVQAAPVVLSKEHLRRSRARMRAIIVNSGNANCATGPGGFAASRETARETARQLACAPEQVLVCSTGVIGVPLKVGKILSALPAMLRARQTTAPAFASVTRAIMTTDTRPKWAAERVRFGGKSVRILGCTKGAGMIQPNMATMLAFIVTDAAIGPKLLSTALREAVGSSFNAITVDGDTSTNDTIAILANGASMARAIRTTKRDYALFAEALAKVCRQLALAIVADGEGAKRVIEIEVRGARTEHDAKTIARTIANSPLVKTALAGGDPNWGRILAAAGRAGVPFEPSRVRIDLAGALVCRNGLEVAFNERKLHRKMLSKYVPIRMDLRVGRAAARIWTCDFTGDYVRINASYRT
ncbi:MAG: bifunctional glutamate N-acetyltransferase/amino-acid acetyltransferase ArgJ [Candidatus Acidiferrales bacterium]|jgi:glutamate N-acetyltransferase/amino-acid N-acetyltransferase